MVLYSGTSEAGHQMTPFAADNTMTIGFFTEKPEMHAYCNSK
jgi:hypothetical protein